MANTNTYIDKIVVPNGANTITASLVDTVSGYAKTFKVTLIYHNALNGQSEYYTVDKTYNEISAAYTAGDFVYLYDGTATTAKTVVWIEAPLVAYNEDQGGDGSFIFESHNQNGFISYEVNSAEDVIITYNSFAEVSHTHGNITNGGALQTSDITIATGDKLVVTDDSDSGKIARSSLSFDTTNTTDYLRKDGTWQTVSGGSSDVLMVTLSYSNSTYSIDSTYDDILQAVSDGKFVYLYDAVSSWSDSSNGGFIIAPLSLHYPSEPAESEFYLYFVSSYTAGGNISFCRYSVDYNNYVSANNSIGVTSATSATSATNATNAYVTATNPTSGTTYYPPFVSGTGNQGLKQNDGLKYLSLQGTTSANGYSILRLGNTTSSGTVGNKYGALDIYPKTGAYYGRLITTDTLNANRTYTLPNATGTVALTSDVPNVLTGTTAPTSSQGDDGDIYIRY